MRKADILTFKILTYGADTPSKKGRALTIRAKNADEAIQKVRELRPNSHLVWVLQK